MAHTTSTDRALTDLRIILWLGLLVAAWLLLAPTSALDGRSCGTPVFHLSEPGLDQTPLPDTCLARNQVRRDQAIVTTTGTFVVLGVAWLRRWLDGPGQGNASVQALTQTDGPHDAPPTRA